TIVRAPSRRLVLALSAACLLLAAPAASAAPLRGFTLADSGDLTSAAARQTHGAADCPAGLVPVGGAVSTALLTSSTINSWSPPATAGAGDVNNPDGAPSSFRVTVACAKRPKRYTVSSTLSTPAPAGQQAAASAVCPTGTKALSGGVFSDSGSLSV